MKIEGKFIDLEHGFWACILTGDEKRKLEEIIDSYNKTITLLKENVE